MYGHDRYSPGNKVEMSRIVEFSPVPSSTAEEDLRRFRELTV